MTMKREMLHILTKFWDRDNELRSETPLLPKDG